VAALLLTAQPEGTEPSGSRLATHVCCARSPLRYSSLICMSKLRFSRLASLRLHMTMTSPWTARCALWCVVMGRAAPFFRT